VRLHYEEAGGGPETVLFVHGYSSGLKRWAGVIDRLPADYRAIAVDLRGSGESDKPESGYEIRDFSEDLAAFARALGLRDFTFVGHSMGGTIAYQFAIDHGDLLKAVVIVTPAAADGIEAPSEEMFETYARRKADPRFNLEVARRTKFYRPGTDWIPEQSAELLLPVSDALLREAWWAMTNLRLGARLGEIAVPALMIGADHDESTPLDTILPDWRRIPGCALHVFSRCNHWPPQEAPDEFTEVLTNFIDGVNSRRTPALARA
jgi:pimeloyl-ACP methyl ester carboxylesterase